MYQVIHIKELTFAAYKLKNTSMRQEKLFSSMKAVEIYKILLCFNLTLSSVNYACNHNSFSPISH